ncbi:hypothetical protein BC827DRAFT_1196321 [Russula dissimulans]|nr:hypothetical protein BC827DRAFT_1196321 [Russula dissimulans]
MVAVAGNMVAVAVHMVAVAGNMVAVAGNMVAVAVHMVAVAVHMLAVAVNMLAVVMNIAAEASGVEGMFVAGFVEDNFVACPGTGNHDTRVEECTYKTVLRRVVVEVGGTVDHIRVQIREPEVQHQEVDTQAKNGALLERKRKPDSVYY